MKTRRFSVEIAERLVKRADKAAQAKPYKCSRNAIIAEALEKQLDIEESKGAAQ